LTVRSFLGQIRRVIGETVGNYRVTKLLGEGGMGAVYLAEHPGIGRKAAVKVLHPDLTRHTDIATRFFNEARAANAIHHPGIVEVLDFGTLPTGVSYIVMEFLDGDSLAKRLRTGGRPPVATALEYARQAAAALGAAHDAGIVHRDLKPDNLYVVPDPRNPGREMIKVLDFGIAKLGAGPTNPGSVKTRTGTIMGTPVYMSPEQCRGTKEVDHRTDIYALGIILYEMLCGTPPFVSEGHGELIHLHISQPPPPPRSRNPEIPARLEATVLRALAKDPAQRFQTMDEFSRELVGGGPTAATPPPRRVPATDVGSSATMQAAPQTTLSASASIIEHELTTARGRRRGRLVVLALAAAAAGGYVVFSRAHHEPEPAAPPVVAQPAAPAAVPVAPPAAKPISTIVVKLSSDPAGARVVRERDGAFIGITPLKETWPSSAGSEKLQLEKEGYRSESVIVPLDLGVELALPLKPLPAPPTHRRASSAHVAPTAATPRAKPSVQPPAPSEPAPAVPAKPAARPREPVPL
jgi:serine/threonine protein kinase